MSPEAVMSIGQKALELATILMLLLLVPALLVGLLVSLFQAATQINEATLSFIPKMVVTLAVMVMAGPFMLRMLTDFTVRLFNGIPTMIG